jgi:hypothetical protein
MQHVQLQLGSPATLAACTNFTAAADWAKAMVSILCGMHGCLLPTALSAISLHPM